MNDLKANEPQTRQDDEEFETKLMEIEAMTKVLESLKIELGSLRNAVNEKQEEIDSAAKEHESKVEYMTKELKSLLIMNLIK